ncbi:hypothetical protein BH23CHL4_BH23CHL4_29290 [soil metagenome]
MNTLPSRTGFGSGRLWSSVPAPVASFIGREREKTLALELLQRPEIRLLTLKGPGGIGKTRFAIELCRSGEELFADGVCFVPLAAVMDADLVTAAINHAIGAQTVDSLSDRDLLVRILTNAQVLLVLDNYRASRGGISAAERLAGGLSGP